MTDRAETTAGPDGTAVPMTPNTWVPIDGVIIRESPLIVVHPDFVLDAIGVGLGEPPA